MYGGHVYNLINRIAYKYFIYCGRHAIYLSGGMLLLCSAFLSTIHSLEKRIHSHWQVCGGRKQMRHRVHSVKTFPLTALQAQGFFFIVNENHKRNTKGHFGYGTYTQFDGLDKFHGDCIVTTNEILAIR